MDWTVAVDVGVWFWDMILLGFVLSNTPLKQPVSIVEDEVNFTHVPQLAVVHKRALMLSPLFPFLLG